jgi:predicted Zn-dependent protease
LAKAESFYDVHKALSRTERLMKIHPGNYAIICYQVGFLLQNKQPDKVISLLIANRRTHNRDPFLHQNMARAYSMLGNPIALHRSQAEFHFARGEFKEAFKQLDVALEYTRDKDPVALHIKARKKIMQAIIKKQSGVKI